MKDSLGWNKRLYTTIRFIEIYPKVKAKHLIILCKKYMNVLSAFILLKISSHITNPSPNLL